ncbi:hypothetical protein BB558_001200 [Smittium angustum]|uniref:CCAAT-binding factor domain-containing protein n=1 Tax=Smittium angustum TaxID=133377 RepID=A0A2U1JC15_SMIAN|nr:hypothetical protein BB558_001200 [Smittium angustum]
MSSKRKREGSTKAQDTKTLEQIKLWEVEFHKDTKNINNLGLLLNLKTDSVEVLHSQLSSLTRIFSKLMDSDQIKSSKNLDLDSAFDSVTELDETEKKSVLGTWLSKLYRTFLKKLVSSLEHQEVAIQISSLRLLMNLLQKEGAFLHRCNTVYSFPNILYSEIINRVLTGSGISNQVITTIIDSYLNQYSDLRFYGFKAISNSISTEIKPQKKKSGNQNKKNLEISETKIVAERVFLLLSKLLVQEDDNVPDSYWIAIPKNLERKAKVFSPMSFKNNFQEAWLAYMRLPLTSELYKQTLLILHRRILPGMVDPLTLMDFLSVAYDSGGPVSLLALNGLFTLITKYNLTYPEFYTKLYALLDNNLLHVKYRSRFFRLLDTFLLSTHLSTYLVAAFIKRMARLCLFATPAGIAVVVPFIYNLFKRHPSCMVLIHRVDDEDEEGEVDSDKNVAEMMRCDPYNENERDPSKCNAINSSIWELVTIQNHYYTNISTIACVFNEPFTKPEYILEDFLDHTYSTMFAAETGRKIKKAPALSNPGPTTLIRDGEVLSSLLDF